MNPQFNSSPSALDKAFFGVSLASFSWKIFLLTTYQAMYSAPGNHITDTLKENFQVLSLSPSFKELSKERDDAFRYQGLASFEA